MNKQLKFSIVAIAILLTRSYDAYCTFQLTPDLSKEANPLVSIGGVNSWTMLIAILSILTVYVLFAFYKSIFKPFNLSPSESGYTFSHFVAYVYLGEEDHWTAILYKFPKSLGRLNQYMGEVLTKCLLFAGGVSTAMWLLINYTEFYKQIHSPALIYSILITGCLIITYRWNRKLYGEYLRLHS